MRVGRGQRRWFRYGDDPRYTNLTNYAWYGDNSGGTTHAVGQKKPNGWGLYDMHGSVWEWCLDWYGSYPGGGQVDWKGPSSGYYRVHRGGHLGCLAMDCRSANRYSDNPDNRMNHVGFRVLLAPGQP